MPTTVEETKTLTIEGTVVEMRPLKIKRLREFMKRFGDLTGVSDDNDASLGVIMDCCVIAMKQYNEELTSLDYLEENLDINEVYLIIEAASGIKMTDQGNPVAVETLGMS